MRRIALISLLLSTAISCGDSPMFDGTEFHFIVGDEEETVTLKSPARRCDFVNSNQGWGVDTDDFGFFVADLTPGTYSMDRYASYGESGFVLDGEAAGVRFSSSAFCDEGATMTIEGTEYGLTYGTIAGTVCSLGTRELSATFAFASRDSGEVRCPQ